MARPVVLVVDSDSRSYNLLSQVIDAQEFEVSSVRTADKGFIHARSTPPRAIFMCVHTKGAFQACQKIREEDILQGTPLVLLHDGNVPADKIAAFTKGIRADHSIEKPLKVKSLTPVLEDVLQYRDPPVIEEKTASHHPPGGGGSAADKELRKNIQGLKKKLSMALQALDSAESVKSKLQREKGSLETRMKEREETVMELRKSLKEVHSQAEEGPDPKEMEALREEAAKNTGYLAEIETLRLEVKAAQEQAHAAAAAGGKKGDSSRRLVRVEEELKTQIRIGERLEALLESAETEKEELQLQMEELQKAGAASAENSNATRQLELVTERAEKARDKALSKVESLQGEVDTLTGEIKSLTASLKEAETAASAPDTATLGKVDDLQKLLDEAQAAQYDAEAIIQVRDAALKDLQQQTTVLEEIQGEMREQLTQYQKNIQDL